MIEDRLADLVESPFKGKGTFDFVGIDIEIKRLLQARKRNILGRVVVPNQIAIVLDRKEYVEYEAFFDRIMAMLGNNLDKWLQEKGYGLLGPLEFDFRQAILKDEAFEVHVSYRKEDISKDKNKKTVGVLVNCNTGEQFSIYPGPTIIGRGEDCAIRMDDPTISRRHASITYQNGKAILEDLGSKSGTRVNRQKVNKKILRAGDKIGVGNTEYFFIEINKG